MVFPPLRSFASRSSCMPYLPYRRWVQFVGAVRQPGLPSCRLATAESDCSRQSPAVKREYASRAAFLSRVGRQTPGITPFVMRPPENADKSTRATSSAYPAGPRRAERPARSRAMPTLRRPDGTGVAMRNRLFASLVGFLFAVGPAAAQLPPPKPEKQLPPPTPEKPLPKEGKPAPMDTPSKLVPAAAGPRLFGGGDWAPWGEDGIPWFSSEFLLWWIKEPKPIPPLITGPPLVDES